MEILDELKAVIAGLDREGIEYALCGGLAMAIYAMPRATLDIDLLIQTDSVDRAVQAVGPLGFPLRGGLMEFRGGDVKIRRLCKIEPGSGEEMVLDFLLTTPATEGAWVSRRDVEWEGRRLTVASPEGLILLKSLRLSGMDQDDIRHLRSLLDES